DPTARIEAPAFIGDNCRISAGVVIGSHTTIGSNAILSEDATVAGSVIMEGAHVGSVARVRGAVLGRGASLERGALLEEGAVVGDDVVVGAGAIVRPNVKIYPSKTVEAGAIVAHSIVRERRVARSLFGARGVTGLVNIGVTPQTAVRLGMAYGTFLRRGSAVVAGRDASRAARTMKRALIAGLNSTGVHCYDLELVPMPVTRFSVRSEQATGAINFRTSPKDPEIVEIRFMDAEGVDLSEADQRKLERIFYREDYRRASPARIGDIEFPPRALEQYTRGLLRGLDIPAIRERAAKVVVDYAFGPASLIAPSLLGRLGCDALGVNAFTDEYRPVLVASDLAALTERLSEHVRKSGSDLGVLLEPGGEVARLVDDRGRVIPPDKALLVFLRHELGRGATRFALPVSASSAGERLVEDAGGLIDWTPVSIASLMNRAAMPSIDFAGSPDGSLIWPRFLPAPDGLMTFGKALEVVSVANRPLSELVDEVPVAHMARRDVATPWDLRGTVMRHVASAEVPGRLVLIDGIKVVQDDGWVLVIPVPDEPVCRVWAEASTAAGAEELADRYAAMVAEAAAADGEQTY
ncbi:MAG TPA: mannose-1-phosphate guanyltransferase, partial [Actinomycetota bacterium]|nr:mannose-1-phosphate guanyltransferase [Actinomycetota bacterium]